jgi:glycolate oxidase FAD binding subunit
LDQTPEIRARYAVDGIVPQAVVFPSSEAEVADALRQAAEAGSVVVPWGAGSRQDLGNPLSRIDLVLSLERLNQVVEYVPADMTVTVQAGMRFAELQALTARNSQMVPLDPPRAGKATIGGIVATSAAGPRRMAYGGVRDLLLGLRLALPDGRVIKAGGKVVKNVAGYDMPKLVAGSLGTLGVITEVSLRLRPLPTDCRTLLVGFADLRPALAAAESILSSELLPSAVAVLPREAAGRLDSPGPVSLALALEEPAENNDYQAGRLDEMMPGGAVLRTLTGAAESGFWDRLTNYGDRFGASVRLKVNTVIGDLENQVTAPGLEAIAWVASGTAMLYGFGGDVQKLEPVQACFARANASGGSAVLESAPVELRRQLDVWGPARPEWKITHALRRTFDPAFILNRGRYVGGV